MGTRRNKTIFIAAVAAVLVLAALAHHAVTQRETPDRNVIVDANYQLTGTHDDNLVVAGSNVILTQGSSVNGDASLVGDTIRVNGQVNGDLTALGKNLFLDPNAQINGDARFMGTNVTIAGSVG